MMNPKLCVLFLALAALWSASCGSDPESFQSDTSALTADQCDSFEVNGKTRICHATGSVNNPYVALNVSNSACVNAHSQHPGDYVASGDPTCNGSGCLPDGAPWDSSVNMDCCPGLIVEDGVCTVPAQCPPGTIDCGDGQCDTPDCCVNPNCGSSGT
jgi:hypothetical protein